MYLSILKKTKAPLNCFPKFGFQITDSRMLREAILRGSSL